ncbi:hypothetical protein niasHT_024004 [Heterodera trifolii]|uniref:C2 domain-containing protein n=1 Tax=Heterodera trifolii TaxID=157864 RepID=A0ABD2KPB5_9BILA
MNPRGNVLVVHVLSVRNLYIRAQKALDVYMSLATSGKGPWKSKVTTNTVRVEADSNARGEPSRWDEHCEFKLNDTDTKLVVRVNHKTMLGTTETLGELTLALEGMARFQTPVWFALAKPGTSGVSGNGERGHIQLGYQFTMSSRATTSALEVPAMSVSNMSLNKIEKEKKFDRLRRKMQQFGRRGSTSSKRTSVMDDSQSLASLSIAAGALGEGSSRRSSSMSSTKNSAALAFSSPTPSERQQQQLQHHHQQQYHQQHNHHQIQQNGDRNVTVDDFGSHRGANANRNSSRRGSMESSSGFASLASGQLGALNENTSPEYLLTVINHLRMELLKKEERIRDMEEYTDKLITKVMMSNPQLLQASPKPVALSGRRK